MISSIKQDLWNQIRATIKDAPKSRSRVLLSVDVGEWSIYMPVTSVVKHKYHSDPRLSANQLADYLEANSTNRRSILRNAKFPPIVLLVPYTEAKSALVGHLARNQAESALDRNIQTLTRKADNPELSDFDRRNSRLCIDAIEAFQVVEPAMKIGKIRFTKPGFQFPNLDVTGVAVSVSINLLTEQSDSKGKRSEGGAMLIFAKSKKAREKLEERCKAVSLLIFEELKALARPDQVYDPTMCMAIDVFGGTIYRAKGEQRLLWKTVGTSCEEVTDRWPSVKPPANYNGPPLPKA